MFTSKTYGAKMPACYTTSRVNGHITAVYVPPNANGKEAMADSTTGPVVSLWIFK